MPVKVATCYLFHPIQNTELVKIEKDLEKTAASLGVRGLVILASEGFNTTLSGNETEILKLIQALFKIISYEGDIPFIKWSENDKHPFRRFSAKVRDEIVTTSEPELNPMNTEIPYKSHLTPAEWDRTLKEEQEDIYLVDTRNWYETQIGSFKGAVKPPISEFTEFSEFVENQQLPKDKKILMFCTGGIRCEKGILELNQKGYENVFQLEGGILNYLKEFPDQEYEGECFVFDHRVSVDQNLEPSKQYRLCPHCGQPGEEVIECVRCDYETIICETCKGEMEKKEAVTCSKNCAHHWQMRPGQKGPRQILNYE